MVRGGDTQSIVFESHWNNSAALASSRDELASCIRITGTESASAVIRHISDCSIIYYLCRVELVLPGGRHTFDLLTSASSTRSTCPRPPRGRSRRRSKAISITGAHRATRSGVLCRGHSLFFLPFCYGGCEFVML